MKKTFWVFVVVFSLLSYLFAFNVGYVELAELEPFVLTESVGSRTSNVNFTVLSKSNSEEVAIVLSGWLFDPGSENSEREVFIQLRGNGESYEKKISLMREGIYYTMNPFILTFQRGYTLVVMGLEVDYDKNRGDDAIELGFEDVSVEVEWDSDVSILLGEVNEGLFTQVSAILEEPVLLIKGGERPTGGYNIVIDGVYLHEDRTIEVAAKLQTPGSGDFVTQAFTYPHKAIRILGLHSGNYDVSVRMEVLKDGEVIDIYEYSSCFTLYSSKN